MRAPIPSPPISESEEPLCPGAADAAGHMVEYQKPVLLGLFVPFKPVIAFLCPLLETNQE